jgi:hypothetical protein
MACVANRLDFRILEIPVCLEDRRIAASRVTIPVKVEAALGVWRIWWRHRQLRLGDRQTA